jgi:cysteinyl-tRNA synthetase
MKIYNSLTKKIEELHPIEAGRIKLYTCGPTVYDHVHIGNLRTYVFEDTLRRTLKFRDYDVDHVMNITDVDDKTIARSRQRYPDEEAHAALSRLTEHYEVVFLEDSQKIGIDFSNSRIARATEHIEEMKALIEKIDNKYVGDDGVYYDITKDKDYGSLVKLDHTHEHHRINNDEYDKDHIADFALWKKQSGDEPAWPFAIDGQDLTGRPGWHIECSAMSVKFLGQPFDIHTGGVDLKFPHHENEIAQSRSSDDKPLANYFMHGEHLLVDGKKMSKKLNNFFTLADIEEKGIDSLALRLLFLQSHYRSQLNFTWESLEATATNLKSLRAWADLVHQTENEVDHESIVKNIHQALDNDLNTPEALAALNEYTDNASPTPELLQLLDELFGLNLSKREDINQEQKDMIDSRRRAKYEKEYALSDKIRDELKSQGIEVRDTDNGQIWSRL